MKCDGGVGIGRSKVFSFVESSWIRSMRIRERCSLGNVSGFANALVCECAWIRECFTAGTYMEYVLGFKDVAVLGYTRI